MPDLPAASWNVLRRRAELLRRLRAYFDARGYLEVETPLLSHDIVVDRHLDPFATVLAADARRPDVGERLWLQTSPEAAMKRLLAAGATALYQVTRSFRNGERGPLHNPEFTIAEWYAAGQSYGEAMTFLSELCDDLLGCGPAERLSYAEAFRRWVAVDPHAAPADDLREAARRHGIAAPDSLAADDRDGWLNLLLVERVEPRLRESGRPAILFDFPAGQAALAQVNGDPPVAERFELYVRGVELANGYHELRDAAVLRRRSRLANEGRAKDGKPPLPEESRLLAAMDRGLPDCCGVALGFDRLVMLAVGATTIDEVLAFPIDRA
jgi:lysyl-tRNA synthetase class 2